MNTLHPKILCAKFSRHWPNCCGEEDSRFPKCILAISLLSPIWKRAWPFMWTILTSLYLRISNEIGAALRKKIFRFCKSVLPGLFRYLHLLESAYPSNWMKWNPLQPRILCVKFCWNWPSGSVKCYENV